MLRAVLALVPEERRDSAEFRTAQTAVGQPPLEIMRLAWGSDDEVGNFLYDYSDVAVKTRWQAGERAAADAFRVKDEIRHVATTLTIER